jgi:3-dehydroquinate dehydratase type II
MERVLVINGPNLNLLGTREPDVYGSTTLPMLDAEVRAWGAQLGVEVDTFQSNHEGALIDRIHGASANHDGIVINPGALTHYSYAIHDALSAVEPPAVEVHISNIHEREPWRRISVTAPACIYAIAGRGLEGYRAALHHLYWRHEWEPLTLSYGDEPDQVADLRVPVGDGPFPVAVVLHGGFWRNVWTRDLMDGISVDLAQRGWATWNVEYRRLGKGGGWPETLEDVAGAIDALTPLADDFRLDLDAVFTVGHSAGGHLALWAAARSSLPLEAPGAIPQVRVRTAVGLAPLADLAAGHRAGLGRDAVAEFLGAGPDAAAQRYATTSPAELVPCGVRQLIVHGDIDNRIPVSLSRDYAGAAADAGDAVVYHELEDADHFVLIDPHHEAWRKVAAEIEELR